MANVNPPPILRRPSDFVSDQAKDAYFRQLEWMIFQLWQRTGGGDDSVDETANQQVDTDALYSLFSQFEDLESSLNLDQNSISLEESNTVSTSANYTTIGNDVVICNDAITVTLNPTPDHLEEVTIKRAAGEIVIDGNGKQIDGNDTITVIRQYTSLDIVYTVETDSWNIV